jgi:hypothetical protein
MKKNGGGNNCDSEEEIDGDGAYDSCKEWYMYSIVCCKWSGYFPKVNMGKPRAEPCFLVNVISIVCNILMNPHELITKH